MTIWQNSVGTNYFADNRPSERFPCAVTIEGIKIVIDDHHELWTGVEAAPRYFELQCGNKRVFLHLSPDQAELVGRWEEDEHEGLCLIELD